MAKAIFHRDFNYSSRQRNAGWAVKASADPQSFPRELIDAALRAGVAELVPPRRRDTANRPDHQGERSARNSQRKTT